MFLGAQISLFNRIIRKERNPEKHIISVQFGIYHRQEDQRQRERVVNRKKVHKYLATLLTVSRYISTAVREYASTWVHHHHFQPFPLSPTPPKAPYERHFGPTLIGYCNTSHKKPAIFIFDPQAGNSPLRHIQIYLKSSSCGAIYYHCYFSRFALLALLPFWSQNPFPAHTKRDWRLETGNWRRKGKRPRLLHSVHANTQTFRQSQEKRQTDTCPTTPCRSRAFGIIKKNKRQRGENKEGAQELEPERESDNPTIRQSVRNQSGSRQPNFRSSTEICKCRTLLYGVVASFSFPGTAIPKEETLRRTKARHRLPWLLVHPLTITTSYSTESIRSLTRSLWVLPVNLLLADRRTGGNLLCVPKTLFFFSLLNLVFSYADLRHEPVTVTHTDTQKPHWPVPRLYHDSTTTLPRCIFGLPPFQKPETPIHRLAPAWHILTTRTGTHARTHATEEDTYIHSPSHSLTHAPCLLDTKSVHLLYCAVHHCAYILYPTILLIACGTGIRDWRYISASGKSFIPVSTIPVEPRPQPLEQIHCPSTLRGK